MLSSSFTVTATNHDQPREFSPINLDLLPSSARLHTPSEDPSTRPFIQRNTPSAQALQSQRQNEPKLQISHSQSQPQSQPQPKPQSQPPPFLFPPLFPPNLPPPQNNPQQPTHSSKALKNPISKSPATERKTRSKLQPDLINSIRPPKKRILNPNSTITITITITTIFQILQSPNHNPKIPKNNDQKRQLCTSRKKRLQHHSLRKTKPEVVSQQGTS